MERVDCVVVGAGVVGLACARELAQTGREVLVLEAAERPGEGISSRNSEVIHAGIYYPPGSLKARLCLAGKLLLYAYCRDRGVAHRRLGKLIVAAEPAQEARLIELRDNALASGLADDELPMITAAEVRRREPAVRAVAALWSPSSGIVDSHGLMAALQADLQRAGAAVVCQTPVESVNRAGGSFEIVVGGAEPMVLGCRELVNAAGLGSWRLARAVDGLPRFAVPSRHLARGHYFSLCGPNPFRHLVYPLPDPGGLGVHVTVDLQGRARFGPDVEWLTDGSEIDYRFDASRRDAFVEAIRRYYPALQPDRLQPAYTGIRPRLAGPGKRPADFVIDGEESHGVAGLVNLFGIESPGLTAALAIAQYVRECLTT